MVDPITASYAQDDADWMITVAGNGAERSTRAPGIIAARDRADQLIEEIAPDDGDRTVVHLLNGSAIEFTEAYLSARLGRGAVASEADGDTATDDADADSADADTENPDAGTPETAVAEDDASSGDDESTTLNGALDAAEEPGEPASAAEAEQPTTGSLHSPS